ncbi:MAG: hypothetical protein WC802_00915 [Patescibacteria group bacterium]
MLSQFFDKRSLYVLVGLLGAHLLAVLVQHSWWSIIPVSAGFVVALGLSIKRLEWGLAFAFLEIFVGGHGHLFDLSSIGLPVSIRMVIFGGVMLGWIIQILRPSNGLRMTLRLNPRRDVPWIIFGTAIVLGGIVGFLQNEPGKAFDDFNSYLLVLYILPILSIAWDGEKKRLMLMTLAVSAVWVALSTLGLLFAFTHLPGKFLSHLYTFVRDARLAEITILTAPSSLAGLFPTGAWYFRVFEQSQIVVLAFEFIFASATYFSEKIEKNIWLVHAVLLAGISASLSRSFMIGAVIGALVFIILLVATRAKLKTIVLRSFVLGLMQCSAIGLLWLIVVFPLPIRPDFTASPFYKGDDGGARELAVSSRWNLLPPMMVEIMKSPIIGAGFGKEVTFVSDDPRVRAINGTGEWTTYRFEWGYQDLWLKMGVFGLLGVLAIAVSFANATMYLLQKGSADRWIPVGMISMIIFVLVTHIFTPYLNHPLGLSLILLPVIFYSWASGKIVTVKAVDHEYSPLKPALVYFRKFFKNGL